MSGRPEPEVTAANRPPAARKTCRSRDLPSPVPMAGSTPADRPRCVIVDDNERFAELAAELLGRAGFEVVGQAGQSGDALRVIIETRPDLVLIDLFLGDESGVELVTEITRLGLAARTCLLLISSCEPSDLHAIFELSVAHGYLSKLDLSGELIRELLNEATPANGDEEHHRPRCPPP